MKHKKIKKTYEKYTPLLDALKKAYVAIDGTHDLQQELMIPSDVTNKLDFVLRTIEGSFTEILKLQKTEKFLWEENLAQFSII